MNFLNLQNKVFGQIGQPDTGADRTDAQVQDVRDCLNDALQEICATLSPRLFALEREGTVAIVSGTSDYYLNDWCQRPLAFRDSYGMPITFRRKKNAELEGCYDTQASGSGTIGGFIIVPAPRNSSAYFSAASGSSTGATVANAATSFTTGSSTTLVTGDTGRMIRFNGEPEDYVFTFVSAHAGTIDRPFISRMSSIGTTGAGSTYTNVRFEIGPKLRYKIKLLPSPGTSQTLTYRYMALPRRMVGADDEPELNEEFHHLLWKGALRSIEGAKGSAKYSIFVQEFSTAIQELMRADDDEAASNEPPPFETLNSDNTLIRVPGTYSRFSKW